ncbi:hypothetical protein RvY_08089-2 [Ramazzottius varieornatus]|uniref:GPI ethanolamine phosphate transferase 1 n=1 Tax=Ramazzottius varieornatus TaxID=947166 RepID=A0A1D1VAD1_RAMVA|nr:hypothetical protein RvY_08089-2 [Ramazzottius varieornatus]
MMLWLTALAVVVHLVFLKAIFDVYFVSPLVHGMTPQPMQGEPPAKRLVLVSCDGLRADKFFEKNAEGNYRMPYLKKMAELGTQGVSSTRVPTESRPGHVAMIGGFYEDVSAVTKGWKDNPVDFDSVFNQSRYTWAWGSPDIVPIFSRVKTSSGELHRIPHIFPHTYTSEFEDFVASPIETDFWVFDRFTEFSDAAKKDPALQEKLNSDRVVLFFHLLGMDTTGHTHKPQSKLYDENMRLIDERMRTLVEQIEALFAHDNRTAFLFTSDHGMTDWGSHGSGQVEEIATPFVAWGAGIARNRQMVDIEQADLTPLMSALLGQAIPVHSVGVLPLAYLATSAAYKKSSALTNIKQIFEKVHVKKNQKRSESFAWSFKPFGKMDEDELKARLMALEDATSASADQSAEEILASLIHTGLEALTYYQEYDRNYLRCLVALCFLGWMVLSLLQIFEGSSGRGASAHWSVKRPFLLGGIAASFGVMTILVAQNSPGIHYLYTLLPVLLWTIVLYKIFAGRFRLRDAGPMLLPAATLALGTEILVLTFFYRPAVSVGMLMSGLWTYFTARHLSTRLRLAWLGTSVLVALFPLLPVVGSSRNPHLVMIAGILSVVAMGYLHNMDRQFLQWDLQAYGVTTLQILVVILCSFLVVITSNRVDAHVSPGTYVHVTSWVIWGS